MCSAPKVPEPTQYQSSKAPVFNANQRPQATRGRAGTILAPSAPVDAGAPYAPGGKKTLLGS